MLSLRKCTRSLEQVVFTGNLILNRNYIPDKTRPRRKTVHPVEIKTHNQKPKFTDDFERGIDVEKIKKEFREEVKQEFRTRGDISETDLELLRGQENHAEMERDRLEVMSKIRHSRMYRKHFRDEDDIKEISILTYAEKEKIRYLHSSDPEEWSPESLAMAFPVSSEGVLKLMKSSFRAKSLKEIRDHDQRIAEKIEQIKRGEVPMTPDLEAKMKMRENLPLRIGAVDPYDKDLLLKLHTPKVIGEFQSLVAAPRKDASQLSVPFLTSGELAPPTTSAAMGAPDLGDSFVLEPTIESRKDLKNVSARETLTFKQFQSKINQKSNTLSPEMQYFAQAKQTLIIEEVTPVSFTDFEKQSSESISSSSTIRKFKEEENDLSSQQESQYHRLASERDHEPDSIHIPPELVKEGSVYQRGNSFYDEKGEFLYRVV